jgi:Bacterial PH domain
MRLIKPDVDRYLLPAERSVITVREHPAALLRALSLLVCALVAAVVLTVLIVANDFPRAISHGIALSVIWVAWSLILLRFLKHIVEWSVTFIALTNQRMINMRGPLVRKVSVMPLSEITDLRIQPSTWGRLLGYGTIIMERAGQDQALLCIDYMPDPEKFHRETASRLPRKQTGTLHAARHGKGRSPDNSLKRGHGLLRRRALVAILFGGSLRHSFLLSLCEQRSELNKLCTRLGPPRLIMAPSQRRATKS